MKLNKLIATLFFAVVCVSSSALAEVSELIDYTYYEIDNNPNSKATVKQRIEAASPLKEGEVIHHSKTQWQVTWAFETNKTAAHCAVAERRVNVSALIHLPELKGASGTLLQKAFAQYVKKLQAHEVAHYMLFAIQAANEVDLMLRNLESESDCEKLQDKADTLAQSVIDTYLEKERAYDVATNFGRAE